MADSDLKEEKVRHLVEIFCWQGVIGIIHALVHVIHDPDLI